MEFCLNRFLLLILRLFLAFSLFLVIAVAEDCIFFLVICVVITTVFVRVIFSCTILIGTVYLLELLFGLLQGKCLICGVTLGIEPVEDLNWVRGIQRIVSVHEFGLILTR
jgi:hypothetical protein